MPASYSTVWLFISCVLIVILAVMLMIDYSHDRGKHRVAKGIQAVYLSVLMAYAYVAFDALREVLAAGYPTEALFFSGRELTFIRLAWFGALMILVCCMLCVVLGLALAMRRSWARVVIQIPLIVMAAVHLFLFIGLSVQLGVPYEEFGTLGFILLLMPAILGVGGFALYRSPLARRFFGVVVKSKAPESLDAMMIENLPEVEPDSPVTE